MFFNFQLVEFYRLYLNRRKLPKNTMHIESVHEENHNKSENNNNNDMSDEELPPTPEHGFLDSGIQDITLPPPPSYDQFDIDKTISSDDNIELASERTQQCNFEEPFQCMLCEKRFSDFFTIECHIKEEHESTNSEVDVESVHSDNTLAECKICDANFANYGILEKHVEFVHGESILEGENMNLTAGPSLKIHIETVHEKKKPFECQKSEEISSQYKCSDCPEHFLSDSSLKLHHTLHHMQFD